jgi:hypothetical protein
MPNGRNNFPVFKPPGGSGWGGPSQGAHRPEGEFSLADVGNTRAMVTLSSERQRELQERRAKAKALKDHIYFLAENADREETQLAAAVAWLNREEGMPVARNININATATSELNDHELQARRAELERAIRGSAGGDGEAEGQD